MRPLRENPYGYWSLAVQAPGVGPVARVDPGEGALGGAVLLLVLLLLLLDLLPGLAALLVALLDQTPGDALAAEAEGQGRREGDQSEQDRNVGAISFSAIPICVRAAKTAKTMRPHCVTLPAMLLPVAPRTMPDTKLASSVARTRISTAAMSCGM